LFLDYGFLALMGTASSCGVVRHKRYSEQREKLLKNQIVSNNFLPCHNTLGLIKIMLKTPATIKNFNTL
jgi:hypothetical protein